MWKWHLAIEYQVFSLHRIDRGSIILFRGCAATESALKQNCCKFYDATANKFDSRPSDLATLKELVLKYILAYLQYLLRSPVSFKVL